MKFCIFIDYVAFMYRKLHDYEKIIEPQYTNSKYSIWMEYKITKTVEFGPPVVLAYSINCRKVTSKDTLIKELKCAVTKLL